MFEHLSVVPQLTLRRVPKQLLHRGVKRAVACGSQGCVVCRGVFPLTHTFVAEAAKLLGRTACVRVPWQPKWVKFISEATGGNFREITWGNILNIKSPSQ